MIQQEFLTTPKGVRFPNQRVLPIARLCHLGKESPYVIYNDILGFFPFPEQYPDQLDLSSSV